MAARQRTTAPPGASARSAPTTPTPTQGDGRSLDGAALPLPDPMFSRCPIRASLGVLGRKWALLVLRDIAWWPGTRFSDIMRNNPGLTPRVLSFRLRELQEDGFLERMPQGEDAREVRWKLTAKGQDAVPILTAFIAFGARHHADEVFADGQPRDLSELFPGSEARTALRLGDGATPLP